jgi:hypothetical protein
VALPVEAVLVVSAPGSAGDDQLVEQLAELGLVLDGDVDAVSIDGVEVDPAMSADASDSVGPPVAWDAARDQYVVFDRIGVDRDLAGIELLTDSGGVVRLYLYVDAFPETDGEDGFQPIRVVVTMGDVDELFTVSPR